jgi:hypothetical protein
MKKLLALLLLSPLVAGEELEYPVELTCEVGNGIYYVEMSKDSNWITPKSSYFVGRKKINKKLKAVLNDKDEQFIYLKTGIGDGLIRLIINRLNLSVMEDTHGDYVSGQCYLGFKEYGENKL